jgi:hypothetical protein
VSDTKPNSVGKVTSQGRRLQPNRRAARFSNASNNCRDGKVAVAKLRNLTDLVNIVLNLEEMVKMPIVFFYFYKDKHTDLRHGFASHIKQPVAGVVYCSHMRLAKSC